MELAVGLGLAADSEIKLQFSEEVEMCSPEVKVTVTEAKTCLKQLKENGQKVIAEKEKLQSKID